MSQQGQLQLLGNKRTYPKGNTLLQTCQSMGVPVFILSGDDVSINPGPNTHLLTRSLINIRSIRNKSVAFADFINSNKSGIIAVTETWL